MGKDSSAVAEERKVWVTDFVAKGCASRFATEWSFVWCKYSEIKSGDKIFGGRIRPLSEGFYNSYGSGSDRFWRFSFLRLVGSLFEERDASECCCQRDDSDRDSAGRRKICREHRGSARNHAE